MTIAGFDRPPGYPFTPVTSERQAFLRERALPRATVTDALARGYVIDPDHRQQAERDLVLALMFRRKPRRTAHLIPVSPEFAERNRAPIENPRALWVRAAS